MKQQTWTCDCNMIHQEAVQKALKHKPTTNQIQNLSDLFKMLGDKTRIKIIWALDNHEILGDSTRTKILWILDHHEMCVCDIANALNMTKSSISHQLAILREAGIVTYHKSGKEVYYMLDDDHIKKIYEIGLEHIAHKMKGVLK